MNILRQRLALVAVLMAPFVATVDIFIVNIAAPSIEKQLHTGFAEVQIVIGGYIVAFALGLVTGGRLGDMAGRRRVFVLGLACFAATSAACAGAPSAGVLIAMRLLQGASAALMVPQVLALIQVHFPKEQQGRLLGLYGATQAVGVVSGQVLGGLLVHLNLVSLGWRVIFLVNVPLCVVALACALYGIPRHEARSAKVRFDPLGVVLLSLAVALLLCPLVVGAQDGWPAAMWPPLVASVPAFALFAWWESRLSREANAALLPTRLFRLPGFRRGLPTAVTFYCGNAGFYLVLAFYLQDGLRLSPLSAALVFSTLALPAGVACLAARVFVRRFGDMVICWAAAINVLGLALIYVTIRGDRAAQLIYIVPGLILVGLGQGLILPSLLGLVLQQVDPSDAGVASGGVLTASQVASALGVAGVGAVFRSVLSDHSYAIAFGGSLIALAVIGIVCLTLLIWLVAHGRSAQLVPSVTRSETSRGEV